LQLTKTQLVSADDASTIERLRASIFLNWSNTALDSYDYSLAVDVLERALEEPRVDHRVKNNLAYVAQEWGASVASNEGAEASQALLLKLAERFPDIKSLNRVAARNYDEEAMAAYDSGDFETAIDIYQAAQKSGLGGSHMKNNEKVAWNNWGLSLLDQSNYSAALSIFERARDAHPKDSKFKANIAYIVQEWGKEISQKEGVSAAEKAVTLQHDRFLDISQLKQLQGSFINNAVNDASTAADFQLLEKSVKDVGALYAQQNHYKKLVAYYYQEWAKTAHPNFEDDAAIVILQSGFDNNPDNRDVKKMFVYAVNNFGDQIAADGDLPRALSIFQSATRSLSNERSFEDKIKRIKQELN